MKELELLKRKLEREKAARKQAEQILEAKALELYTANESLRKLNESLEDLVQVRTKDLQESEEKYRNVIENASDIIYTTDKDGFFTFINPKGVAAFGFHLDEIIGKRFVDFVLDDYKQDLFEYYTKIRKDNIGSDYFEFPIRSKDKEIHWIGQNVNRVEDQNGSFYYNAVARDITLRKTAEEKLAIAQTALTQSEVKYRSVLENLELGLMEVDLEGKIIRVYDHFCRMTGYEKEELIGKDAIKTLLVEEFEHLLRSQDANRTNSESGVYEVQLRRKDGKHIWVLISGAPFYNSKGEVIGSLGVHYEITDRKDLEQSLQVARHKAVEAQKAEQQFLAHMSHEIRTPLNAIIGMTHLLKETSLEEKQQEFVDILGDSASLLKGLVSDILDISKIDSGVIEKNETTFDLSNLANRLIQTFKSRAFDKGLLLESKIVESDASFVISDKQWIHQILINLISNAIKFTSKGSITLSIQRIKKNGKKAVFYFEVSDTGIGMNPDEVKTVFSSFKQANKKIRTDFGGTGLGLSIATRLVSLLGGQLEVKSEMGKGSSFFFSLPMETAENQIKKSVAFDELDLVKNNKVKLLVVEDNIMNQKYISTLLNKWNIAFDIAENGKIAVDKCATFKYDLIFMDLSMPVMDGYEATNMINAQPGAKVPIIALTASTFLSKKELALNSGMTDFLAKPFTPEELSGILQKYLSGNNPQSNGKKDVREVITLDMASLENLYKGDQEYALEMFNTYKMVINPELDTLESLVEKDQMESIKKQLHKIKPMFKMVGLDSIYADCESLYSRIGNSDIIEVKMSAKKIIQEAKMTFTLIDSEIKRLEESLKQTND